jgi:HK97 family phage prohead protease
MTIEHKNVASESLLIKADEKRGIVTALVSVMGIIDLGGDVIPNGAYKKTITERAGQIRVLDQHRTDSVLAAVGRPIKLREIGRDELPAKLRAKYPDATGALETVTQFNLNTAEGRGVFQRIADGDINEWSIGYEAGKVSFEKRTMHDGSSRMVRILEEIILYEYSTVLFGMNQATMVTDAKTHPNLTSDQELLRELIHQKQHLWQIWRVQQARRELRSIQDVHPKSNADLLDEVEHRRRELARMRSTRS